MSALRILAGVASLMGLAHLAGAQEEADSPALWTFLREAHDEAPAELGRRVAASGAHLAAPVVQALRERTCALPDNGALVVGPREEAVLLAAVAAFGRAPFTGLYADAPPPDLDADARRALLQILAEVGVAEDAGRALDLGTGADPGNDELVETFEAAVGALVARDARALGALGGRFLELEETYTCAIARAVADHPSHVGVEFLVEMIGFRDTLDTVLLSLTTKAAKELDGPFDEAVRTKVRLSLGDEDFQVLRKAAMTVAVLEDFQSTELLIELLGNEHAGVRDGAHWGLRELTGLDLRQDSAIWGSWLASELLWYEHEAPLQRRKLVHGNPVQVADALGELGRHRYERYTTADLVADALRHENPRIRQRACGVLRQLDARVELEGLVDCLEDRDPGVAEEAHRTLLALTGRELPPDAEAWRAARP